MAFRKNQLVRVRCSVEAGPLDESVVTIETADGPISGFVKTDFVTLTGDHIGYVVGQVVEARADAVKLRLPGSFFTTSGLASVATHNLHAEA